MLVGLSGVWTGVHLAIHLFLVCYFNFGFSAIRRLVQSVHDAFSPRYPARNFRQYLAVSTYPTPLYSPMVSSRLSRPAPASIQIWSFGPETTSNVVLSSLEPSLKDAKARCELVLCISAGPALDIKWCPLPAHDSDSVCIELHRLTSLTIA